VVPSSYTPTRNAKRHLWICILSPYSFCFCQLSCFVLFCFSFIAGDLTYTLVHILVNWIGIEVTLCGPVCISLNKIYVKDLFMFFGYLSFLFFEMPTHVSGLFFQCLLIFRSSLSSILLILIYCQWYMVNAFSFQFLWSLLKKPINFYKLNICQSCHLCSMLLNLVEEIFLYMCVW
jgi:hypothetical protein